jgi:hypothetical protein
MNKWKDAWVPAAMAGSALINVAKALAGGDSGVAWYSFLAALFAYGWWANSREIDKLKT